MEASSIAPSLDVGCSRDGSDRIEVSRSDFAILTVGDGNLSFSQSLAKKLWRGGAEAALDQAFSNFFGITSSFQPDSFDAKVSTVGELPTYSTTQALKEAITRSGCLVSSVYESSDGLIQRYPESRGILKRLTRIPQVCVVYDLPFWEISTALSDRKFDAIVWNHPHIGIEDLLAHKVILSHFFHTVSTALKSGGRVCVSLVDGQAERWELLTRAQKQGFKLISKHPFLVSDWPTYEAKRNNNGKSFKNTHTQDHVGQAMRSSTYVFSRPDDFADPNLSPFENMARDMLAVAKTTEMSDSSKASTISHFWLLGQPLWVDDEKSPAIFTEEEAQCLTEEYLCHSYSAGETAKSSSGTVEESMFRCNKCLPLEKIFRTSQGLYTHNRQVHELSKYKKVELGGKEIVCHLCDREFRDLEARDQHLKAQHDGNFKGDCSRSKTSIQVRSQDTLAGESHEKDTLIEEIVEPYACEVCGQSVPGNWSEHEHLNSLRPKD